MSSLKSGSIDAREVPGSLLAGDDWRPSMSEPGNLPYHEFSAIVLRLGMLTDEQRVKFLRRLGDYFCRDCGRVLAKGGEVQLRKGRNDHRRATLRVPRDHELR